jgi:signal recognition particle GTPase
MSNRIYLSPGLKLKLSQMREKGLLTGDSIEYLSGNFFYEIVNDLESSHQQKTVAVICAGAYIESLYLSLKSFEKYDYNSPLFKKLAEQQFAYKNMLAYLRQFENEKEINELVELLRPVEELYSKMHFTDNKLKVEEGSDSTLIISGGKVYKMDELTYIELKNETEKIRLNFLKRQ